MLLVVFVLLKNVTWHYQECVDSTSSSLSHVLVHQYRVDLQTLYVCLKPWCELLKSTLLAKHLLNYWTDFNKTHNK